jgi:alpha/beta superfamily hydrolase
LSVGDARIGGWFGAAPPLRVVDADEMIAGRDVRPKVLAVPERDQFRPPESARAATSSWISTRIEVVPGADHFFVGRTQMLTPLVLGLFAELSDLSGRGL